MTDTGATDGGATEQAAPGAAVPAARKESAPGAPAAGPTSEGDPQRADAPRQDTAPTSDTAPKGGGTPEDDGPEPTKRPRADQTQEDEAGGSPGRSATMSARPPPPHRPGPGFGRAAALRALHRADRRRGRPADGARAAARDGRWLRLLRHEAGDGTRRPGRRAERGPRRRGRPGGTRAAQGGGRGAVQAGHRGGARCRSGHRPDGPRRDGAHRRPGLRSAVS